MLAMEDGHGSSHKGLHHASISPRLEPRSDRSFFKRDYPDDLRPVPTRDHVKAFAHPYPAVQDHHAYDVDFVKDENSDNGEWQAQMEYDSLRTKLRGQKNAADAAYRTEQEEKHHLEEEEYKELAAEEDERKATAAADQARKDGDKRHRELEDLVGKDFLGKGEQSEKDVGGAVGDAINEVKNKMTSLEDCQRQLAEAKAELEELMELKQKREKEKEEADAANAAARAAERAEAEREGAEAAAMLDANVTTAEEKLAAARAESQSAREAIVQRERDLERRIAEAEGAHLAALRAYREEEARLEEARSRLQKAAARVREHRAGVDQDGGVYKVEKPVRNGGRRTTASALLIALASSVVVLSLEA